MALSSTAKQVHAQLQRDRLEKTQRKLHLTKLSKWEDFRQRRTLAIIAYGRAKKPSLAAEAFFCLFLMRCVYKRQRSNIVKAVGIRCEELKIIWAQRLIYNSIKRKIDKVFGDINLEARIGRRIKYSVMLRGSIE